MKYQDYCTLFSAWLRDLAALVDANDVSVTDVAQALFDERPGLYPVTYPLLESQSRAGDALADRAATLWPGPTLEPPFCASDARWVPAALPDVRYPDAIKAMRDAQALADGSGHPVRLALTLASEGQTIGAQRIWIYPLATFDQWMIERDADGTEHPIFIGPRDEGPQPF